MLADSIRVIDGTETKIIWVVAGVEAVRRVPGITDSGPVESHFGIYRTQAKQTDAERDEGEHWK